jgi:hypothetical protein
LSASRSETASSPISGYCTRSIATRPSGETSSVVPSTFGSSPTADSSRSRPTLAWRESAKVTLSCLGVATTYAVSPPAPLSAPASRSAAAWESVPGAASESSNCFPKPAEAATTRTERSTQAPMAIQGRVADQRPQRYSNRDMDLLLARWSGLSARWLHARGPPARPHRRRGRTRLGRWEERRLVLSVGPRRLGGP